MLLVHLEKLRAMRVILASESPRRREILGTILKDFEVEPSSFEENLDKSQFAHPRDYVVANARGKAGEVAGRASSTDAIVISADTVVVRDERILEKPKSVDEAKEMLWSLSGRKHVVYTGVCICYKGKTKVFAEGTDVVFAPLTDAIIDAYVATGEPMDKAGSYGIQALGGLLVSHIEGSYHNVVGFPLFAFCNELVAFLEESSVV
eukprot:GEMP01016492.1.p1 GENE.GEMP01016492.1~~GEMP01016492.1.p1  ORF type:complete len:225 (+),score=36.17 GEMP01016492.1:58-675(+)